MQPVRVFFSNEVSDSRCSYIKYEPSKYLNSIINMLVTHPLNNAFCHAYVKNFANIVVVYYDFISSAVP